MLDIEFCWRKVKILKLVMELVDERLECKIGYGNGWWKVKTIKWVMDMDDERLGY
jgi:ethanolamine utilization protein EutQ (cupin superfamily)